MYISNKQSSGWNNIGKNYQFGKGNSIVPKSSAPLSNPTKNNLSFKNAGTSGFNSQFARSTTPAAPAWQGIGKGQNVDTLLNKTSGFAPTTPQTYGPVRPTTPSGYVPPPTTPSNAPSIIPVGSPNTGAGGSQTTTPQISGLVTPSKPGTTYGGLVTDIANRSKTSSEQKRLQRQLEKEAQANKQIGEEAKNLSAMYGKEIADLGKLGAGAVAGDLSTGSNVVGSGNAAIASQSVSSRMQALGNAQQAALQGTGQQLQGQSQTTNALNNALSSANSQQSIGLSGLGTAAGYAQPQVAAYGQTTFDPLTGQYSGGNMDPQAQAANLAQQVTSGRMTYDQALASLGYAGSAGANFLNNAITGAGGNPLQLQAQGVAQQGNITSSGTAGTDIARAGLMDATQQYVQMNTAAQTAHQQSEALLNIMNTANINGQPLIRVNKAWNQILQETSDPNIASYFAALEEARGAYSALLSTGGSAPTENDRKSIGILSGNSTPQATAAAIQQLEDAVARKLSSQYSAMQQYSQNLGTGSNSYSGGGGTWDW